MIRPAPHSRYTCRERGCRTPIEHPGWCVMHRAYGGTTLRRYQDRCLAAEGIPYWDRERTLRQVSKVLAVIAWAACFCPSCRSPRSGHSMFTCVVRQEVGAALAESAGGRMPGIDEAHGLVGFIEVLGA